MKRRILAVLCMAVVLVGVLSVAAVATEEPDRYLVGYGIRDINPWSDPDNKVYDAENPDGILLEVPVSGYANSADRPAGKLADDNGDGIIDNNDGLQVTCTCVTDAWENTVMYFTVDAISGYGGTVRDLRAAMVEALGENVIREDRIMFTGSHTHEGVDLDSCRSESEGTDQRTYYNYALSQMVAVGIEAYENRSEAVMTKGEIDASKSSGYQLNFVRHYNVEVKKKANGVWSVTNSYVSGSNFGGTMTPTSTSTTRRTAKNVSEANDTMYLLQFAPTNGDAPIVLVNWRGHATLYGGGSNDPTISSDYINAMRYQLQKAGYRASFIQSAAGNVNCLRISEALTPWCGATVDAAILPNPTTANLYGYLLSQVALDCLENKMTQELDPGEIHTAQISFSAYAQADSEGLIAAANEVNTYYTENGKYPSFPYKYTDAKGEAYIINSKYHANNIIKRRNNVEGATKREFELNAISMGRSVAMVTSPCEMFDRYSLKHTLGNTNDNDWLDLVNEETYGTPWLLGYTNGHNGYIPNALAYTYNQGHSTYGVGSYEANTSLVAQGEGEKFIVRYAKLLELVTDGYKIDYCQHCNENVQWTPWLVEHANITTLKTGHYYLVEDFPATAHVQQSIDMGAVVCIDLNGHDISTNGRSFNMPKNNNATLNVMGEGAITSYSKEKGNNPGGGLITVGSGCTLNIYGGTWTSVNLDGHTTNQIGKGGVASVNGVVNMYGGKIIGANLVMSSYFVDTNDPENGCGAAMYIYGGGALNVCGGKILNGSVPEGGKGACVYAYTTSSKVNLSGDAVVDEIYYNKLGTTSLSINGSYTGKTTLAYHSANITLADGLDIGNCTDTDLSGARISCVNSSNYSVTVSDRDLKLTTPAEDTVAVVYGPTGAQYYKSLEDAFSAYSKGFIKLVNNESKAVSVDRTAYLDLNGFDVPSVTVRDGYTLYCLDSKTDDYTVEDAARYGTIGSISGDVIGVPENWALAEDGYLMVEEEGETSFHRVNLQIYAMTLRPDAVGLYYNSYFAADEVVARNVKQFGIALSVIGVPTERNIHDIARCSEYTDFKAGLNGNDGSNTGTLLKGIMKITNTVLINERNAVMPVYGRAYIETDDGYMFGEYVVRDLKEQVEGINAMWGELDETQQEKMLNLYETFTYVMKNWNIPDIISACPTGRDSVDIPFDALL